MIRKAIKNFKVQKQINFITRNSLELDWYWTLEWRTRREKKNQFLEIVFHMILLRFPTASFISTYSHLSFISYFIFAVLLNISLLVALYLVFTCRTNHHESQLFGILWFHRLRLEIWEMNGAEFWGSEKHFHLNISYSMCINFFVSRKLSH